MSAMTTTPPTTPPAIAPTFVDELLLSLDEPKELELFEDFEPVRKHDMLAIHRRID